jgi:hypothetical protein
MVSESSKSFVRVNPGETVMMFPVLVTFAAASFALRNLTESTISTLLISKLIEVVLVEVVINLVNTDPLIPLDESGLILQVQRW